MTEPVAKLVKHFSKLFVVSAKASRNIRTTHRPRPAQTLLLCSLPFSPNPSGSVPRLAWAAAGRGRTLAPASTGGEQRAQGPGAPQGRGALQPTTPRLRGSERKAARAATPWGAGCGAVPTPQRACVYRCRVRASGLRGCRDRPASSTLVSGWPCRTLLSKLGRARWSHCVHRGHHHTEDAVLQQNRATSHLGISGEVEDKYGFRTMLETSKGTTLVKHAATTDASCSKDTESSDDLIVKQRMLIQQLVEKTQGMTQKIARLERVIHQLDADHQGNVKMLDVAKDFFDSFKPTRAANGAIEFFSEDDEDIVQKINHMKDFFSYFVLSDRVKSKGMDKVA
ncbi:uncharacterized protein [Miscanthus floridulus]|uniref:uncharacterized protein n=1 Tax=Miscanthus floridulus TaxID=154761 RepID=UPI0034576176